MSKLNLIDWDILNRVYYCLYQKIDEYKVVVTTVNNRPYRIKVTHEVEGDLFSIDHNLNIEAYGKKTRAQVAKCLKANGINAT